MSHTPQTALVNLPYETLCPGALQLEQLQNEFR
jgi:hypothetical protein